MKADDRFRVSRNEQRRRVGYISSVVARGIMDKNVSASMTFGKANRPSTPIQGVISQNYASHAENEISQRYDAFMKANRDAKKAKRIVPGNTRARELQARYAEEQNFQRERDAKKFTMRRFEGIAPRT